MARGRVGRSTSPALVSRWRSLRLSIILPRLSVLHELRDTADFHSVHQVRSPLVRNRIHPAVFPARLRARWSGCRTAHFERAFRIVLQVLPRTVALSPRGLVVDPLKGGGQDAQFFPAPGIVRCTAASPRLCLPPDFTALAARNVPGAVSSGSKVSPQVRELLIGQIADVRVVRSLYQRLLAVIQNAFFELPRFAHV